MIKIRCIYGIYILIVEINSLPGIPSGQIGMGCALRSICIKKDGQAIVSLYKDTLEAADYEKGESVDLIDAFKIVFDHNLFVYGILFGQNGEDGRAQGMANFFSLKTSLGGIISCALGMSKYHLNQYLKSNFPKAHFEPNDD